MIELLWIAAYSIAVISGVLFVCAMLGFGLSKLMLAIEEWVERD
jgi:hypothetical protein